MRDTKSLKVVGTYRLLNPSAAREVGRYYSDGLFDLTRLNNLRSRIPFFFMGHWSMRAKCRVLGCIMLFWIVEDFL